MVVLVMIVAAIVLVIVLVLQINNAHLCKVISVFSSHVGVLAKAALWQLLTDIHWSLMRLARPSMLLLLNSEHFAACFRVNSNALAWRFLLSLTLCRRLCQINVLFLQHYGIGVVNRGVRAS